MISLIAIYVDLCTEYNSEIEQRHIDSTGVDKSTQLSDTHQSHIGQFLRCLVISQREDKIRELQTDLPRFSPRFSSG